MIKKIICAILSVIMCLSIFTIHVQSSEADERILQGAQILLGDALGVRYITTVPYDAHTRATFACNGRTKTATPENVGGYCAYSYNEVIPNEFELPISITIGDKTESHTLKEIAVLMLKSNFSDTVYELVSDMLRYCKASADYRPIAGAPAASLTGDLGTHFVENYLPATADVRAVIPWMISCH